MAAGGWAMTTDARKHLNSGKRVARQLAVKVTPARVAAWARHMKLMLAAKE